MLISHCVLFRNQTLLLVCMGEQIYGIPYSSVSVIHSGSCDISLWLRWDNGPCKQEQHWECVPPTKLNSWCICLTLSSHTPAFCTWKILPSAFLPQITFLEGSCLKLCVFSALPQPESWKSRMHRTGKVFSYLFDPFLTVQFLFQCVFCFYLFLMFTLNSTTS